MDFYKICERESKDGSIEVYPDWIIGRSKDLMVRGRSFYAIWDEEKGLWSTDEYDVQRLVDQDLDRHIAEKTNERSYRPQYMKSFSSNRWNLYRRFIANVSDSSHQLNEKLIFANTKVKQTDYVSRRLPYALEEGDISAWDKLVGFLYNEEERRKIEWAIGAIVSGDSRQIQKFLVLYGPGGTGKSTVLNIIAKLFDGYTVPFDAKAIGSGSNQFSMEIFKTDPLVAIQHDGDLSQIQDNTKLNSIIAHEVMPMNEKFKAPYEIKMNAFLFMGTNQPVKITDGKSGLIRRLIDVHPSGEKLPPNEYHALMGRIDFELGAIAAHCLKVYKGLGKNYYNGYIPLAMMLQTDVFFNFIEAYYDEFKSVEMISLRRAYTLYKEYCGETGIEKVLPMYKVRHELENYFEEFRTRAIIDGKEARSVYVGFKASRFKSISKEDHTFSLTLECTKSLLDRELGFMPAQYATDEGTPEHRWADVKTILVDIQTDRLHYVKVPEQHIVIDFDLKDAEGKKSLEKNLAEASGWPATYAELSQGGHGVHLHYIYEGDTSKLAPLYSEGIEVKVFPGNASLRRRLSRCNDVPIATLNGGLPLKENKMLKKAQIQSEKGLRDLISRNLRKEIHPGTKPSIDFIHKILEEAADSGLVYDVSDMRPAIMAFAASSSNHSLACLKVMQTMKFTTYPKVVESVDPSLDPRPVFFDVEVYPNLFIVCWKYDDVDDVIKMINPSPESIEDILKFKLVGFNNRRYDNHILYARYLGYNNEQLYKLSKKIIEGDKNALFGAAYDLSYTDVYDFSSKKQGLKKFQIELGIPHKELDLPWDDPVPEDKWFVVADYCANDVTATQAVFNARKADFTARQILAELSGLSVNETTQKHTARIIFGADRNPQQEFEYTDLRYEFPDYVFEEGKSTYHGESVGEGGYVYSEPGMYGNVLVLDVASMHPTSIVKLHLFGKYTFRFSELLDARLAIKHKDYAKARKMLGGRLSPYLSDAEQADALAYALKIVINIVYGLTSAHFDNPFRDPRNKDNIVAKRGALFMIDLKYAVQDKGFQVVHIKTDSIKIPNATEELSEFIIAFGRKYGYEFEMEGIYDRFCLVNDAVYIARKGMKWDAVGAQFQHPIVYKSLFSHEPIGFDDFCETKSVTQGAMYLDFEKSEPLDTSRMQFVGRTGRFIPVDPQYRGGTLYRVKDGKFYAVSGTKGYQWMEAETAKMLGGVDLIDTRHYSKLVDEAQKTIKQYGDLHWFLEDN